MTFWTLFLVVSLIYHVELTQGNKCVPKLFENAESVVCVCNATYCDSVVPVFQMDRGTYAVYTTSKAGLRLDKTVLLFDNPHTNYEDKALPVITINRSESHQTVLGFGGAFTDAAAINIKNLSAATQDNILLSYFSGNGIEYSLGRVPIASCDFSTRNYSYDDTPGDFNMSKFTLAPEDLQFKIPVISRAMQLSTEAGQPLMLFASPWSAPYWMKTNQDMTGEGTLKGDISGEYFQAYARYLIKFLESYQYYNITFWGLTVQNEPTDGFIPSFPFQAMGWTPTMMRDFIKEVLGPVLKENGYADLKLMILDDQRLLIEEWADIVLSDKEAAQYVSGIAVHWYIDFLTPTLLLDKVHEKYGEKFILGTEACEGSMPWQKKVVLGSWDRAEGYSHDIIQDLNHWVAGWTDWNLALNMQGGPNWVKNFVDSPIIVNAERDEFYKQPMFYIMGHVSKFVKPGSRRIGLSVSGDTDLEMVAFTVPENFKPNATVVIISNRENQDVKVVLHDPRVANITTSIPAHSILTYIWWDF